MKKVAKGFLACLLFAGISFTSKAQEKPWMLAPFVKQDAANPCLLPSKQRFVDPVRKSSVGWEEKDVFNPAAVVRNGKIYLLYRAQDSIGKPAGTSRIGLAYSSDGLHFTKLKTPVLYPDNDAYKKYEWEGGCEDPRIVEDDNGTYYMTYTAYDGTTARLFIATSKDLVHWTKHGSVFKNADGGKYINYWSKSGSIICTAKGDKLVTTKIKGKYWMYWGESNIYMATSDNLIDWTPIPETDPSKKSFDSLRNYEAFKILFSPRKKKFDSELVEPGPPAMITKDGIRFIYNSKNSPEYGDKTLPDGVYAAGQILLDKNDPTKVVDRCEHNFFKPDKPYEITGQVNNVCFLEGLVPFKGKWFLYYGTADSKIAVAVH
ncbi:glycoside hydrolase family 130 protein [Flavisolibacter ginsenosidimutans]|uniref:Family 43 glycosylhydrolase n=1 Tax=Flavisolibacter ginsenosidimutans TaxID=661481 RepID=A0A5B8UFW6_9BACT|nr:glycoside hydrolase family 130 protein [Flavisolibacter ginsenosidimutans]QEC55484.1 family 43 glycosylhydrolase [Flavisolibacter ginsenosidimutans]